MLEGSFWASELLLGFSAAKQTFAERIRVSGHRITDEYVHLVMVIFASLEYFRCIQTLS